MNKPINHMISAKMGAILADMRALAGNDKQILVSIEELNELAAVLCKFPRYDDPVQAVNDLRAKTLDEVADVNIILEHVYSIFGFSETEVETRISQKMERIQRWTQHGSSMQITLEDRKIKGDQ